MTSSPPAPTHSPAAGTTRAVEVVLPGIVEPDGLQLRTRDLPPPARGQALVAVEASGVSFAEQSMRRGRYPGQPRFPFVPGYDLVGTVTAVGDGADAALVGTRVAALTKTGGWASHVLLRADALVPVPAGLDPAEAETLVVNGLTAWQVLHRRIRIRAGQTVLVHGANGGVGTLLVQLAVLAGARVIAVARPRHHDALRALGGEAVTTIDYADTAALFARVREVAPAGVDAVVDNVGGDVLRRSWAALAPGGTLVSVAIVGDAAGPGSLVAKFLRVLARLWVWNVLPNRRRAGFYDVWGGHLVRPRSFRARLREDLGTVLGLLADGSLTALVAARVPLSEAPRAMQLAEARAVPGKVVLLP